MTTAAATAPLVTILGLPFQGGQPKNGVDKGPQAMREVGLEKALQELSYEVKDLNDFRVPEASPSEEEKALTNNAKNAQWVGTTNKLVADYLHKELTSNTNRDNFLLALGGDHSIAIGTISAHLDSLADAPEDTDLCIIWVDAHADINTPLGSASGNIHGMPVAFLMRDTSLTSAWTIPGFEWMEPSSSSRRNRKLNPNKLVYIGLRDIDPEEEKTLARYNIKNYRMSEIRSKGMAKVMEEIVQYLHLDDPNNKDRLHLSFDIDGLDPGVCPATGTAVEGGLTVEEGCAISEACGKTGRLGSMDLVEVNPVLSDEAGARSTAHAGLAIVRSALSSRPQARRYSDA